MLNPDGVIVGNNRCSLSGKDLNRQYRTVMRESYPSVWHTKLMIRRLLEECGVAIYCDLHAHSRKHNIFAYGCESKRAGCNGRLSEQVFPLMLHKNAADKVRYTIQYRYNNIPKNLILMININFELKLTSFKNYEEFYDTKITFENFIIQYNLSNRFWLFHCLLIKLHYDKFFSATILVFFRKLQIPRWERKGRYG